jgi:hypothetical protein
MHFVLTCRKYDFDGVVMEIAVPQFFEGFISHLADSIHSIGGDKEIIVVIPPYVEGYPSAEVLSILRSKALTPRSSSILIFTSTFSVL